MELIANKRVLNLENTQIMGILNVTPDSFFDGGVYNIKHKAIDHVYKMIIHGATVIDIGGESTRPGSYRISEVEEAERVLPVLKEIISRFDIFISVNTSSTLVMRESIAMGVHLINDVRSLESEEAMAIIVSSKLPVCLTHVQGEPSTMQNYPNYFNVINSVYEFFDNKIKLCESAGINRTQLLLDPGFGFGKSLNHNYQLLFNLKYFHKFHLPLLVGISRKSMLNCSINTSDPGNRLIGSIACAVISAIQGVQIIRVHDVKETMEALQVIKVMKESNKDGNFLFL